jgi:hypothetical protein
MRKIGSRYRTGLVIVKVQDEQDESVELSERWYVTRQLLVRAEHGGGSEVDLVAYVDLDVVAIERGTDIGYSKPPMEIYRLPFPRDPTLRRQILRLLRQHPKFFVL